MPLLLRDDHVRVDSCGFQLAGRQYHSDAFIEVANGAEVTVYHDPGRPKLAYVAMSAPDGALEFLATAEMYGPGAPPPSIGEQREREAEYRARADALRARKRDETLVHDALSQAASQGRITGIEAARAVIAEFDRLAAPPVPLALPPGPLQQNPAHGTTSASPAPPESPPEREPATRDARNPEPRTAPPADTRRKNWVLPWE